MSIDSPTLVDLEAARAELAQLEERWDNYSGNNPNKYQSDLRIARTKVEMITLALKASGLLEKTPQDLLNDALDKLAPNANHGDVVAFEGRSYRRRFFPARKSRAGNVTEWGRSWDLLKDGD